MAAGAFARLNFKRRPKVAAQIVAESVPVQSPSKEVDDVSLRFVMSEIDPSNKERVAEYLREKFTIFTSDKIVGISKEDFRTYIQQSVGSVDAASEGYNSDEIDRQRDLSIKFAWGHNHDFGDFRMAGRMRDRHIDLMANFVSLFPISLSDFTGASVLDIGCWTGGTTLLLAALGSNVDAIEEVNKYAEMTRFLVKCFGMDDNATVENLSIYRLNSDSRYNKYDIAYFPGVIYHLSDPVLCLRIIYNSLRDGGTILIESAGLNVSEPYCQFDGNYLYHSGSAKSLTRGGWNWFIPSPSALHRMIKEAGFEDIQTLWHEDSTRVYGYARKSGFKGICKAGLSVPEIR